MKIIKEAAVLVFVTISFGILYLLLNTNNPDDFGFKSWIDPMYFASTTMSSVGYGDYSPRTVRAKIAVMIQQLFVMTELLYLFSGYGSLIGNVAKGIPVPTI
jgi:hypothetical protein